MLGAGCSLFLHDAAARSAEPGTIVAIEFVGNEVTRESTMRREMLVTEGDAADADRIERSRQAIQDLGLFRSVKAETATTPNGKLLRITVVEKWYVLPIPRVEANSDEEYGLGLQLRWSNVWGLNHTLDALWVEREVKERNRDEETAYGFGYSAPLVAGTPYSVSLGVSQSRSPIDEDGLEYHERRSQVLALVTRNFNRGPASRGWKLGGGLQWFGQNTAGAQAPPRDGNATALNLRARYRDVRFNVYSETGRAYAMQLTASTPDILSDYGFTRSVAWYEQGWRIGETPHQTASFRAEFGSYHGGVADNREFSVGGASVLRGYDGDFREGDLAYRLVGEALRPMVWDWLRGVVLLEVGNAFANPNDFEFGSTLVSVGVGVRVRLTWFVNVEVELGIARGLTGGGKTRVFAGGA